MGLISISGRAGHGKDLTGKIINILLNNPQLNNEGVTTFLKKDIVNNKNWQIKKFADKLKDIVCILLGCTREQLEDQEFKEKELGEEWDKFVVMNGIYKISTHSSKEEAINKANALGYKVEKVRMTPRLMLQLMGTECGREIIHPEIWVASLFSTYTGDIETWLPIENYESLYEISNLGKVRSLDRVVIYGENKGNYHTRIGQDLKGTLSSGYETVSLSGKTHSIHVLVAKHFVEGYKEGYVVNHIDYNKVNNFYKNLEWVTAGQNILHNKKTLRGAFGESQKDSKLTNDDDVVLIRNLMKDGVKQRVIAKNFKVSPTTISDIKKGRKWSHVGKDIPVINPITPNLYPNWIITDCRFPNELKAVEQKGGITIRVTRPKAREVFLMNANEVINTTVIEHISETALDSAIFQYEITNDGTLDELIDKVRNILEKEGFLTKTE